MWISSLLAQSPAAPVSHAVDRSLNVALGVQCTHCHAPDDMRDRTTNPKFAIAARMMVMVTQLNRGPLADTAGITCWSCHEGQLRPSRVAAARWQDERDRNFVGDLASASDTVKLTMAVYNASLGVSCDFCHVPGDWKRDQKEPFKMVERMSTMIETLPAFLPPGARTQCFMCHKGRTVPATSPLRR
jgi:hypothetical protein